MVIFPLIKKTAHGNSNHAALIIIHMSPYLLWYKK
jgi:hypothetical protein